jgi:thymidylate synthase
MSHIIKTRNINTAFVEALWYMRTAGVHEQSRAGPVIVMPGTFQTEYQFPNERVLFNNKRDCNHVFHLMEAIWMLAGRNDVAWLLQFNSKYDSYADEDGKVWGAYGARWRSTWFNQLTDIVNVLRAKWDSRQAVLQMWDHTKDLGTHHADRPCNTHAYFDLRGGVLNMTVCCRSNDMLWGAYGANVVHFSILLEVLAAELRVPVGVYRQFSNNFHLYTDLPQVKSLLEDPPVEAYDPYAFTQPMALPFVQPDERIGTILEDAARFCEGRKTYTKFITEVCVPLKNAYLDRKRGMDIDFDTIPDCDWKMGFRAWVANRSNNDEQR